MVVGKTDNNEKLAQLLSHFSANMPMNKEVQAAQREFYDCMVNDLDRHVLKVVKFNEDVAQAALQNAWLKIFVSAHTYNPQLSSVKTWAKKIGEQCAIDELRRFYSRNDHLADISETEDSRENGDAFDQFACQLPEPDEQIHGGQIQKAIAECIERLPSGKGPNYRLAMQLSLDDELSYQEMKEVLSAQSPRYKDLNAEQVRGWVRQAAAKMKGCITEKLSWIKKETK